MKDKSTFPDTEAQSKTCRATSEYWNQDYPAATYD